MEIQREDKGADPHRARFHSSVMDLENLDAGQEFHKLPDTFTIFITEKDFYGKGEPIYFIERMNSTRGKPFADGEHILYVNGEHRSDSNEGVFVYPLGGTPKKFGRAVGVRTRKDSGQSNSQSGDMGKVIEDM